MHTATADVTMAAVGGAVKPRRRNQLAMNSATTTTFPPPCHSPIALARVPLGMASQSIRPNTAATKPPTTPAKIIQYAAVPRPGRLVTKHAMSKKNDVASRPSGKTISI